VSERIEAFANPKVLVWARRMAGLELEEAARKVGTPAHRLESWERGERRPSITQLRKLADVYKRPLAVFYLRKPPPDDAAPSDFRRFDPEAAEPLSPELRLAIRDARTRRETALELFAELDELPPEFKLTAKLRDDPEKVGARLRDALAGGTPPPRGDEYAFLSFWRAAVENAGALVCQAEGVDVDEMRGFSISERPLPAVILNIKDAPTARCFSLMHELAHVMLDRGGLCLFEESGPQTDIQRTEVFCNHVAGAALLPAESLLTEPEVPAQRVSEISDWVVAGLAKRYGASREAVLRRLVILNRLPLAFYQRKREEYKREYQEPRQTQRRGGFAPPYTMAWTTSGKLFTRLVLQAYDEDRITASDVAGYLGVRLKHLERIRAAVREESGFGEPA
jgi:Zn-dependent peptidase ImmA (M78 family)/transcriptional regulator with XRE-family HTH domain